jgi:DNA-binding transcriptional LysR family regulator
MSVNIELRQLRYFVTIAQELHFGRAAKRLHVTQEAIQMQTIVSLVSAGMGIALVPQSVGNLRRPGWPGAATMPRPS